MIAAWAAAVTVAQAEPVLSSGDVPVAQGWTRELVAEGLEHPWAVAALPDGALLVTERPGRLRLIRDGKLLPDPVPGVPEVAAVGQGGLLDLVLHPGFAENRLLYVTYAKGTTAENRTALARARFDGERLTDLETLWENPHGKQGGQHFGSRLLFLPDGTLLMSVGDGGNPPLTLGGAPIRDKAQDRAFAFGKVLRFTAEGKPAPDNPYADGSGVAPLVWTLGHRNIQGLARDAAGRVWVNEHGALGGDELNRIEKGANYGWPKATWSREYRGPEISPDRSLPGMEDPVLVWTAAVAPSGLVAYDGALFPQWRGDLFSGGLIAQDVRRLDLNDEGEVVGQEGLRMGARVRDVRQAPDGALYVLTDERTNSRLFRIVPRPAQ